MVFDRAHDSGYLRLFAAMQKIAEGFQTPEELRQDARYGDMPYEETLSMAYENIQQEAQQALDFARSREMEGGAA